MSQVFRHVPYGLYYIHFQMTKDYGDDNDSNYEKVLEMSRIEEHSDTSE